MQTTNGAAPTTLRLVKSANRRRQSLLVGRLGTIWTSYARPMRGPPLSQQSTTTSSTSTRATRLTMQAVDVAMLILRRTRPCGPARVSLRSTGSTFVAPRTKKIRHRLRIRHCRRRRLRPRARHHLPLLLHRCPTFRPCRRRLFHQCHFQRARGRRQRCVPLTIQIPARAQIRTALSMDRPSNAAISRFPKCFVQPISFSVDVLYIFRLRLRHLQAVLGRAFCTKTTLKLIWGRPTGLATS